MLGGAPDTLLLMGGRGAGKTRSGAEWVNAAVRGLRPFFGPGEGCGHIALVGESLADVREVMIDGPSGICRIHTALGGEPRFEAGRRRLLWPNGAVAQMFSSEDPESLRGPQFDAAWGDEVAKWKNAEETFDMLQFGLRLGQQPRQILTTTPRPTPLMRRLLADAAVTVRRVRSRDNAANLAPGFIAGIERRYRNSKLVRQELEGELIDDREDALWSRAMIEASTVSDHGERRRTVVAVDPPAGSGRSSNACGIVAAALLADNRVVVLADASVQAVKPNEWAKAAVALYRELAADCMVAEVNQGGDMVGTIIHGVDPLVNVKSVRARRGKWLRAEPVAAAYAQGLVVHAGRFAELEDEMCDFGPNGLSNGHSPDRLDALVWAVTELLPSREAVPRVRVL